MVYNLDNFDEYVVVGLELGECAVEADGAEKVGPCARGIFHHAAEEMNVQRRTMCGW